MASLFSEQSRLTPLEKEKIRKKLTKYHYADEAMNEIVKIVENFKELKTKPDMYVFDNGEKHELLSLHGTFQLICQGQMHNVSVRFWFTINFPVVPPVVYVIPNPGMQIKPSRYLAPNGKVFLPYLHNWTYPQSKLEYLIQILLLQFTDDPPKYEGRSPTHEGRSPTHKGRSSSREGRSPCSPAASTTPAPSYLSYLKSWFQTPATITIPPATSMPVTATTRPNSSVVSAAAAAPITSRAPTSLPAVSATRSRPSSADASTTTLSLETTATIASSLTSATVTTSATTAASVPSQPVSQTCPGCSSLALVVEQQAAELRSIRCIVEGQAHQNTSDAIDDLV